MSRKLQNRALLAAALLWTACRTVAPPPSASLPDPFAPPVAGGPLTPAQDKAARSAWAAARHGDSAAVAKQLAKVPAGHPVRDLIALEARYAKGEAVGAAAFELATGTAGYAAAWQLAAEAAEREGRTEDALASARRTADLRADEPGRRVVARLESAVVAAGVAEAGGLLGRGDAAGALARARRVLEIVPGSDGARMLAARAALGAGQAASAAELLPALPDTPQGLELKGKVAEALGQWDLALDFYTRLPGSFPGRCELVAGAREQARMTLAPPQVSRALGEPAVTRRQLASLLIWEAPFLAEKTSGPVPVFEDVIGLPEGRDIVVAVRAGVMVGDAIARRFGPNRPVSPRELMACLERLAGVAAKAAPHWCEEGGPADECLARPVNLDGKTVAGLLRSVAGQEESPCSHR